MKIQSSLICVCFLTGLCRVFCVKFSCDASYVISGSDDTNLRLWKAKASEQLGIVSFLFVHTNSILAYPFCSATEFSALSCLYRTLCVVMLTELLKQCKICGALNL
jgi:WD40 repeat protein